LIRLEDIWRTYQMGTHELHALAEIHEEIEAGEHVAIMGPSGSGKSTLLNIMGCLDRPTRGSYLLDGREVRGLDELELSRLRGELIGHVFQAYHLVPRLNALENVELPMIFAGYARSERRALATEALHAVGLVNRTYHRPSELSGGECQRVAIARATVMQPRVVLADEPTGNLDRSSGEQVLALLDDLQAKGMTLVVVTHDPEVARRAERVIILEDGRIVHRLPGKEMTTLADVLAQRSATS
jgi:putative ABC transport system ATP-binding protein